MHGYRTTIARRAAATAALLGALALAMPLAAQTPARSVGETLDPGTRPAPAPADGFREIDWQALVPADWNPRSALEGLELSQLQDGDPRAIEALRKLQETWRNAPASQAMDGARIKIPGFIVPLDARKDQLKEFLLVPYYGACIHVPPPPSNQVIHVVSAEPLKGMRTMDAVWVSGTLAVERSETSEASASYRLVPSRVEPYEEPPRKP